jgi:RNA recognition motif-containing protein
MSFPFPTQGNMPMMPQQPFNVVFNKLPMAPPLYIGDLDENIHDETLHDFFSRFGPIHFVRIMRDPATGKSRGFGFVNFIYPRDAESARQYAQYEKLGRKNIRIMFKRNIRDLVPEANVFVKNLDPNVTVKDLEHHFSQVGPIICAKVSTNSEGVSLGYGYVQFEKKEDADTCVKALQGSKLKESELNLIPFMPKDRRGSTIAKRNIYIKNLPVGKSESEIDALVGKTFSQFGEIETKVVKKRPDDNKYSAFVCFKDEEAAQKAVREFTENQKTLDGAEGPLYVTWHQGKTERIRELKRVHTTIANETNLFVKNLRPDVTEAEVKTAFQHFGQVTSVAVKEWKATGEQKPAKFGFVAFSNGEDAKKAQLEGSGVPEIRVLYNAGIEPYINLHQSREKRNEYLYTRRRRRMQAGIMNMDAFRGVAPFAFANRRFQPFPAVPTTGGYRGSSRGGRPQTRGPHQGGRGAPRHQPHGGFRQQHQVRGGHNARNNFQKAGDQQKPRQPHTEAPTETGALTVQNLRNKLNEFLQLDIDKQRQILGELLFPLIRERAGETIAPKITGMLIDLSVLEVSEILEFLENPQLLDERVSEAEALIKEEGN